MISRLYLLVNYRFVKLYFILYLFLKKGSNEMKKKKLYEDFFGISYNC